MKVGGGELESAYASAIHAGANKSGRVTYRVAGGWITQGPYEQPTGVIPGADGPLNPGGTHYPDYENHGLERIVFSNA